VEVIMTSTPSVTTSWFPWFSVSWDEIAPFAGQFSDFADFEDIINICLSFMCVVCAGLAAGLTMGMLSLDQMKLEIKSMTGTDVEKRDAQMILPIVKQHHLLLCTLLLFNSLANEALPVFLDSLVPNWLAIVLSVTLVLMFGEILPSAFFTGPTQLHTAATFVPFVRALTLLLYPLAYPLSLALDYFFGKEEEEKITREELGALVMLQGADHNKKDNESQHEHHGEDGEEEEEEGLTANEVSILTGMLKLSKLTVKDRMISIKEVFMMSDSTRLDETTLDRIWHCGYSRIPVYHRKDKQHVMGYILVKALILINAADQLPVESLPMREPLFVRPDASLLEMLSLFRGERTHMAMVTLDPAAAVVTFREGKRPQDKASIIGIITMEDVIEQMLQGDIKDETDQAPGSGSILSGKMQLKGKNAQHVAHQALMASGPGPRLSMTGPRLSMTGIGILSMGRSTIMQKHSAMHRTPSARTESPTTRLMTRQPESMPFRYGAVGSADLDNVEAGHRRQSSNASMTDGSRDWSRVVKASINIDDIGGYE